MSASGLPAGTEGEVQCLVPLIARVLDLGRGPPALVRWVRRRLAAVGAPAGRASPARRKLLLLRLARDLAAQLRPDDRRATVAARATVRAPRPGVV